MGGTLRFQESRSVDALFRDIYGHAPLTSEEEQRLGHIIEASPVDEDGVPTDPEATAAVDKLVLHNAKYAISMATKMGDIGLPMDDRISAGLVGLLRAARKFRPGYYRFASYARFDIRAAIQLETSKVAGPVSHPVNAVTRMSSMLKYRDGGGDSDMSPEAIAEGTGMTKSDAISVLSFMTRWNESGPRRPTLHKNDRLDAPEVELLADVSASPPDRIATILDARRIIERCMVGMPEAQEAAIRTVFFEGGSRVSISAAEGVTRQAVDCRIVNGLDYMRRKHRMMVAFGVLDG
jgi:RNA polymerase sigma factor (sigma-70 family)